MFFVVSFSLTNVVVEPLRETNLLPIRATHSGGFPSNLWVDSCQDTKRYSCKPPTVLNVLVVGHLGEIVPNLHFLISLGCRQGQVSQSLETIRR